MIYNSAKNTFYELFTLNKIFTILIVIFVNFSNNSYSSELDNLFFKLKQSTNPTLAMDYEAKIWNLWLNNGSTESNNSQMQKGLELLQNGKLDQALSLYKNLSKKGRKIELCFSCYEYETIKSKKTKTDFKKNLDLKYETLKILNI